MAATTAQRMQKHRANMRASGMKLVQIWVPDTKSPGFAEECRRQSRMLDPAHEAEILEFIEAIADTTGWEA